MSVVVISGVAMSGAALDGAVWVDTCESGGISSIARVGTLAVARLDVSGGIGSLAHAEANPKIDREITTNQCLLWSLRTLVILSHTLIKKKFDNLCLRTGKAHPYCNGWPIYCG
jgi:hypothetical protein